MKPALVDTDILSLFFRGDPGVTARFGQYVAENGKISLSIITYYEILSGLKHKDARRQLKDFLEFAKISSILLLTDRSATISAEIYAKLRKQGQPVDDIDLLIAGIAISNNLALATHNVSHFGRIEGLETEDWCKT